MDRKELAVYLHHQNFNCAQSVACAFCNVLGYDPQLVFKLAEPLGRGMGLKDTCGCITGMGMAIGMKTSDGNLDAPETKDESYLVMEKAFRMFEMKRGTTICAELRKDVEDKPMEEIKLYCDGCIKDAVEILDYLLLGIEE